MKKHLLTCILAAPILLFAQQTYVWNVLSGSWTDPTSWNPQRSTPQPDDILEFSSNAAVINMPAIGQIGKLRIYNSAEVIISSSVPSEIDIGDGNIAAPHFSVEAGSALQIKGNNDIRFQIGAGYSGEVSGNIDFFDGGHRLLSKTASSLIFKSGAVFTANTGFDGNSFGTTNLNSVTFEGGAQYINKAGGNPFGAAAPGAVTVFQSGSIYWYQRNGVGSSLAGRTFGHFYVEGNLKFSGIGSARDCIIQNDLKVISGCFSFKPNTNGTHSGNFNIYGDIICEDTSYIDIGSDNMPGAVQLPGSDQTIGSGGGTGSITIKNLSLNNNSTLLNRDVTVSGVLHMQNGIIQTSASSLLKLATNATLQTCAHDYFQLSYTNMGCDHAYIAGPVQKQGLNNETFAFPVGLNGKLRPVILHNATGDFIAEFINSDPYLSISGTMGAGIHHISHIEYWNITGTGSGNIELTFYDPNSGGVTDMDALRVAWYNGSQWVDGDKSGSVGTPGSNGSVTSGMVNEFGSFTLAGSTNYPNNPLPITLTEWKAILQKEHVLLQWTVSGQNDIKEFIAEKSVNGKDFKPLASPIQLENSTIGGYQLIDKELLGLNNCYRLKIIFADGRISYSEIIMVSLPSSSFIKVYPNPAREKIFIKIPASSSISGLAIVNIYGSVVKWVNTQDLTIACVDILNLSPGLYYIKTIHGQSSLVVPFIKYNQ